MQLRVARAESARPRIPLASAMPGATSPRSCNPCVGDDAPRSVDPATPSDASPLSRASGREAGRTYADNAGRHLRQMQPSDKRVWPLVGRRRQAMGRGNPERKGRHEDCIRDRPWSRRVHS